jgi:hypothetical protein
VSLWLLSPSTRDFSNSLSVPRGLNSNFEINILAQQGEELAHVAKTMAVPSVDTVKFDNTLDIHQKSKIFQESNGHILT